MINKIVNLFQRQSYSYEYQTIPMNDNYDIELQESIDSSMLMEHRNERKRISLQERIDIIKQSNSRDECGIEGYTYLAIVCFIIILFICIQIYRSRP